MNELEIFSAALELSDPEARLRYLEQTCRGNKALRDRIEALLRNAGAVSQFLETPALPLPGPTGTVFETAAGNSPSTPQRGLDRTEISPDASSLVLDFLGPSDDPKALGRIGQYTVTNVIGRGGMGIVLKARDTSLNRVVAIKVLAPELSGNPMASKRFLREARAAAAVVHQHIVTIHGVHDGSGVTSSTPGSRGSSLPYLVMEYVDGQSLQAKIDAAGQLDLKETLRIGAQVAAGLAAAHAHGVVHRDIKPSNILLENGIERVRITDFGLARAVDDVEITRTGEVSGTPQYMSPEQAHGQPVDARSDLFSFGSVLYAMCTGRPPFRAETTIAAIRRVCDDAPRPISEINPEVPDWLTRIVDRLLAKRPEDRFQTAQEVAERLGQCLAHVQQPGSAPRPETLPSPPRREWPGMRGKASLRWATAAMFLVAALAGLGVTEATGVTHIATTIIRIATGEGTLIIEIEDPTVQVSLDGEELTISGGGVKEMRLRPGRYQFTATRHGAPIKQELVTITRGRERVVTVSREAAAPGTASAVVKLERGAFVVLGGKSIAERKFDTLAEAVLRASDGDTIEIRGNGPFVTQPITLSRALTIRAGEGFRPVLTDATMRTSAALVLEGLELRRTGGLPQSPILRTASDDLSIANCRFVAKSPQLATCINTTSRHCVLRNSEFVTSRGVTCHWRPVDRAAFVADNCVHAAALAFHIPRSDEGPSMVRLTRNSLLAYRAIELFTGRIANESDPRLSAAFEVTGNVFDSNEALLRLNEMKASAQRTVIRRLVDWHDDWNLYAGSGDLLQFAESANSIDPASSLIARGDSLEDWKQFWNVTEAKSRLGEARYAGGDIHLKRSTPELLKAEDFRLRPDSAGYRAGKDGKDLGANVDLVGPGTAYERWKKTPDYQDWLKETGQLKDRAETKPKTQPFVRLGSKDLPDRKFDTLAEAVLDASDGDTIEIRGNGPFDTRPISIAGKTLTIRAGQAYRPVIRLTQEALDDSASILLTDAPLVLEGLELRQGTQHQTQLQTERRRGPHAIESMEAPLYIANCTFLSKRNHPNGGLVRLQGSRRCELRNCLFLSTSGTLMNWFLPADQGALVVDNCVRAGSIAMNLYTSDSSRDTKLQVRRTTTVTPYRHLFVRVHNRSNQSIGVQASENVFEAKSLIALSQRPDSNQGSEPPTADEAQAFASRLLDWRGERNVYSMSGSRGYLDLTDGTDAKQLPMATPMKTLRDWERFLNSEDAGSLEGKLRFQGGLLVETTRSTVDQVTPDDFRLRPDSAGYRAGPDGKDLGADIDFVGPGPAYERWKKTPKYQDWLKETAQLARRAPTKPERKAFAVLIGTGAEVRKYDTLAEAVLGASDGDTIEIRGNGPFVTDPINIGRNQALTIRAGEGSRPVIQRSPRGLEVRNFLATNSRLALEGLEFQGAPQNDLRSSQVFVTAAGPGLHVANCRFIPPAGSICIQAESLVCDIRNSEIFGAPSASSVTYHYSGETRLAMHNCVANGLDALGSIDQAKKVSIRLTRNTLVRRSWPLALSLSGAPKSSKEEQDGKLIDVDASENVISGPSLMNFNQFPPANAMPLPPTETQEVLSRLVAWRGRQNLYSPGRLFLTLTVDYQSEIHPDTPLGSLADWKRFWGSAETGSLESGCRHVGGDMLSRLSTAPETLRAEDFRLRPDSAGYRAGPDGKDLGADVDLVGPGKAYERWKTTSEYQQWLKETAQGK